MMLQVFSVSVEEVCGEIFTQLWTRGRKWGLQRCWYGMKMQMNGWWCVVEMSNFVVEGKRSCHQNVQGVWQTMMIHFKRYSMIGANGCLQKVTKLMIKYFVSSRNGSITQQNHGLGMWEHRLNESSSDEEEEDFLLKTGREDWRNEEFGQTGTFCYLTPCS